MEAMEAMLTVDQVAQLMNVSPATVRREKDKRGGLPAYKIGGCVRFKRDEVEEYIRTRAVKPPEKAQPFVRGHFKYVPGMKVVSV